MSLADKLASKLKYNNKSIESVSRRRTQLVRDSQLLSTGTFTGLILVLSLFLVNNTYATSSSITITLDDNIVDLNVAPTANGAFSKSSASKIGVSTTNYTGYTLSISASGSNNSGSGGDSGSSSSNGSNNPTALINGDKSLSSIETAVTEEQFKALDNTAYNNMWGYLPSKYCSASNGNNASLTCTANDSFLPSPTTDGDTLDVTSTANATVNEYEITLGARVDATASLGSYSNVFLVDVVANKIPYTITYLDNTISNMPTDVSDSTTDTTVEISKNTPTRNGYTFIGWCTVVPTNNANGTDTCSGTSVGVGGTLDLEQTSLANNFTLYAMWSGNYTIDGVSTMQEFSTMTAVKKAKVLMSMVEGQRYELKDNRDQEMYYVAKLKDGNVWMLDNLRLGGNSTIALDPSNTNILSEYTLPTSTDSGFAYNNAALNATHKNDITVHYGQGSGKRGVYYDYCVISAGTYCGGGVDVPNTLFDAPQDICPASWRLPSGGAFGEFQTLCTVYNGSSCGDIVSMDATSASSLQHALSISLPGWWPVGSTGPSSVGQVVYLYSATNPNNQYMYRADITSTTIQPQKSSGGNGRGDGFSVRCLLR